MNKTYKIQISEPLNEIQIRNHMYALIQDYDYESCDLTNNERQSFFDSYENDLRIKSKELEIAKESKEQLEFELTNLMSAKVLFTLSEICKYLHGSEYDYSMNLKYYPYANALHLVAVSDSGDTKILIGNKNLEEAFIDILLHKTPELSFENELTNFLGVKTEYDIVKRISEIYTVLQTDMYIKILKTFGHKNGFFICIDEQEYDILTLY